MRAHDSYLTNLLKLGDAVFNIPVYQRNYSWDTDNCKQLFQDIETVVITEKEHFIGSIVYITIGTATEPYYNIIDGQQRITSIMLFLKALHDLADDKGFRKRLKNSFLTNVDYDGKPKVKLKQVEYDQSVYERIIMQDDIDDDFFSDKEKDSNVYKNYNKFKELIAGSDISVQDLYNALFKLEIIDVCLTTEDPQEVFESMNSTGKSLTNTDLLRNYLLMDLPHSKQEELYTKYWSKIEENVGTKQMDSFMVNYLIMKRKSDSINIHRKSSKINKNTLYDCYKIFLPPESKKDNGTEKLLMDMCKQSANYRKIIINGGKTELDKAINELIVDLNAEPTAVFLMYLFNKQESDGITDKDLLEAVKACTSYVFRVRIFKGTVSPQFFALAIQHFEKCDQSVPFIKKVWSSLVKGAGSYRFPRDREFQDAFENKNMYLEFKPPMLRYILYSFEKLKTKDVVPPDGVSIEHILPQEPREWQQHLIEIHDDEYYECMHRIGNLTLTKMNSEASNSVFVEKKVIYAKSGFVITREISSVSDWNSKEIKTRSKAMAKEAVKLWALPAEFNKSEVEIWGTTNMSDDVEALFNQFRETMSEFDSSIYEEPKKLYINYMRNQKIVLSLVPCQDSLFVTLNATQGQFNGVPALEDISGKGHWGVGNYRMKITSEDDIWASLDFVQKIIK